MKSFKVSNLEIVPFAPNETTAHVTTKRDLSSINFEELEKHSNLYRLLVFEKKEDEYYGYILLSLDEWNKTSELDFTNVKLPDKKELIVVLLDKLAHFIESLSKYADDIILVKNAKVPSREMKTLKQLGFAYKDKEKDILFIRKQEKEIQSYIEASFIFISLVWMLLMFLS